MIDYEINLRMTEIKNSVDRVIERIDRLAQIVKPKEDLWDNSELIRRWKISERTLATWRSKGLINYIQMKGKIWYSEESRDEFLHRNLKQY